MKHNRLKLARIYLVGPMDHDREAGRGWRIDLAGWLESRKALPIDPYNKPMLNLQAEGLEDDDSHELRVEATRDENWDLVSQIMTPIVNTDLRIVDYADAIVCNLDLDKHPCGSYDEIFMAAGQRKPIVIHCPQGKAKMPPWMFGRLNHELFFNSWDKVHNYLDHIDKDDEINTLGKWKFFDLEPLIRKVLGIEEGVDNNLGV